MQEKRSQCSELRFCNRSLVFLGAFMVYVSNSEHFANIFFLCLICSQVFIFIFIFLFLSILKGLIHMKSSDFLCLIFWKIVFYLDFSCFF